MINTKHIIIASLLVIFSIGLFAVPQAFADVTIENAVGSSTPGCEDTADGCFIPSTVTVSVGEIVTWENNDTAAHTASAGNPSDGLSGVFDSSLIMAGGSYSYTTDTVGTFDYHCMVHPWMAGILIVEDGSTSSTPADTVPPQVLVPDDITLQTEDQNGASATFNPQAIDNIDELITPTCSPASGSVFAIGTTEVVCTATDSSGNTSSNSFNVIIEYTGSLIPEWVKNVAGFWHDGSINDASFLEGISYLIQNNIVIVPTTESGSGGGAVPDWVKNTAGWWANDEIDDDTFVNAITYLIQQGLIQV
uniref:Plastocyanin n=1 Tax=uncultured marine thaumarchaeote KM3_98_C03 TaxID=1456352 RepID=A0A075I2X8_9ARCH|nr:Plastocyanin [uncultured marine thaumarchaeote KM3_98_C03]